MDSTQKHVGEIWSSRYTKGTEGNARQHWWQSKQIGRHIAKLLCGEAKDTVGLAIQHLIKNVCRDVPFRKAVSVGCGNGAKEMGLVEGGIVSHFDLYELSEEAIRIGKIEANKRGLGENITFHLGDAFTQCHKSGYYDFVYWDNALHHMSDADQAIAWSKDILAENGFFFMFDFVGPSRFQWSDVQMHIVKNILEDIDDMYFIIPNTEYMWKKEAKRATLEEMIQADPSEAADSDNIIPAFQKHFPAGTLVPLGGLVYMLGLECILVNIAENSALLSRLLKMDALLSKQSHNYYAAAYGFK